MHILCVIPSLSSGGSGRVLVNMVNYWASKSWHITIATCDDLEPFYDLATAIHLIPLGLAKVAKNKFHGLTQNICRIRTVRRLMVKTKPDVVISFLGTTNIIVLLASLLLGIPVCVSERNNPRRYEMGRIWKVLRFCTYPFAISIVVQTEKTKQLLPLHLRKCVEIIPNPVITPSGLGIVSEEKPKRKIIAVGRLHPQKGFDILIRAFAKICKKHPGWHLTIYGEGDSRHGLEELCKLLGVTDRVSLPGVVKDIDEVFKRSSLFILSSRYEGFPNALCEAMAHGLPVISTDCPTGPSDIIKNGINGILVRSENVTNLAEAMDQMISHRNKRKKLGDKALEIRESYSLEKIMCLWERLIKKAVRSTIGGLGNIKSKLVLR